MTDVLRLSLCLIAITAVSCVVVADVDEKVDDDNGGGDVAGVAFFERRIRPILVEHCYRCHSANAKRLRANLMLDSRAGWHRGGDNGPVVLAGDTDSSLLLRAVSYDDELKMPPDGKLGEDDIEALTQWVAMGAPDPRVEEGGLPARSQDAISAEDLWSFQPPVVREPPMVRDVDWPSNEIDQFVLARLEAENLKPTIDADRVTLIRRAYFDLIGLPPTPAAIDAFVNDPSPTAFAKVVDDLLASPHFGERWGRHWLDVARFAESTGGGRSQLFRNAWRYRDYVIDAFNNDKPYDRFIAEQIAGDLMPFETDAQRAEQLIAPAFLQLGPKNLDHQDKELLRMDVVDEQIDTLGRSVLGMTLGCARCHDHKFDPVPTRDYYALAGIFRSTKSLLPGNVSGFVERELPTSGQHRQAIDGHKAAVDEITQRIRLAKEQLAEAETRYTQAIDTSEVSGFILDDTQAVVVGQWKRSSQIPVWVGEGYLHDEARDKGEKRITYSTRLPQPGRYEVRLSYTPGANRDPNVPVTIGHSEGQTVRRIDQRQRPEFQDAFVSLGRFSFTPDAPATVTISTGGTTKHVIADAVQFIPQGAASTLPDARLTEDDEIETREVTDQMTAIRDQISAHEKELAQLKSEAPPPLPRTMSVQDEEETGDYFVCIRGNVHSLGEEVSRGALSELGDEGAISLDIPDGQSGRLQLAQWMASRQNPLTARVMVNRIWQHLLGAGLVRTVDNFGATGEMPSHPELLDWLAIRFMNEGWSVKTMIRRVMLSRTYQLSSAMREQQVTSIDPGNRLLSHANRRRIDAEGIRDAILSVTGDLDLAIGGPTIDPGVGSEFGYQFESTRRSVYIPVFRNALEGSLAVFDFADPNLVVGKRTTSTLPTQALYLMNSPFVIEQASHAATRLLDVDGLTDAQRADLAYRWTCGRVATPAEHAMTLRYLAEAADPHSGWSDVFHALFGSIDFRYLE